MRLLVVSLDLLLIALVVPSYAQSVETLTPGANGAAAAATAEDYDKTYISYRYEVGYAIVLNCSSSADTPGITYTWTKNGNLIEKLEELKDRYEILEGGAVLRVKPRTNENDFGYYKCIAGGQTLGKWRVSGVPSARMIANVDVVEGQMLKLTCRLIGKPYPPVEWRYVVADFSKETKETVEARLKHMRVLDDKETGVPNGILMIAAAEQWDAGNYTCAPLGGSAAQTVVRVKGSIRAV